MSTTADAGLLARAIDWLRARLARDNELAMLSHLDMHDLAADLGITDADTRDVIVLVSEHGELMDRMLRGRGLEPDAVRRCFGAIVRDLEVTCARCRDSRTCRRELDAGTAAMFCHDFCPNAAAMDRLQKASGRPAR